MFLSFVGSNPSTKYWMGIFHICLFEKTKINEEDAFKKSPVFVECGPH